MNEFSFIKGWNELKGKDRAAAKKDIMSHFGITTKAAFCNRRRGDVEPRLREAKAIEEIFSKYGVKKKDVWGYE